MSDADKVQELENQVEQLTALLKQAAQAGQQLAVQNEELQKEKDALQQQVTERQKLYRQRSTRKSHISSPQSRSISIIGSPRRGRTGSESSRPSDDDGRTLDTRRSSRAASRTRRSYAFTMRSSDACSPREREFERSRGSAMRGRSDEDRSSSDDELRDKTIEELHEQLENFREIIEDLREENEQLRQRGETNDEESWKSEQSNPAMTKRFGDILSRAAAQSQLSALQKSLDKSNEVQKELQDENERLRADNESVMDEMAKLQEILTAQQEEMANWINKHDEVREELEFKTEELAEVKSKALDLEEQLGSAFVKQTTMAPPPLPKMDAVNSGDDMLAAQLGNLSGSDDDQDPISEDVSKARRFLKKEVERLQEALDTEKVLREEAEQKEACKGALVSELRKQLDQDSRRAEERIARLEEELSTVKGKDQEPPAVGDNDRIAQAHKDQKHSEELERVYSEVAAHKRIAEQAVEKLEAERASFTEQLQQQERQRDIEDQKHQARIKSLDQMLKAKSEATLRESVSCAEIESVEPQQDQLRDIREQRAQLVQARAELESQRRQVEQFFCEKVKSRSTDSDGDLARILVLEGEIAAEKTRCAQHAAAVEVAHDQRISQLEAAIDKSESQRTRLRNSQQEAEARCRELEMLLSAECFRREEALNLERRSVDEQLVQERQQTTADAERIAQLESALAHNERQQKQLLQCWRGLPDLVSGKQTVATEIPDSTQLQGDVALAEAADTIVELKSSLVAAAEQRDTCVRSMAELEKEQQVVVTKFREEMSLKLISAAAMQARVAKAEQEAMQAREARIDMEASVERVGAVSHEEAKRLRSSMVKQLMYSEDIKSKLLQLRRQLADALGMERHEAAELPVVAPPRPDDDDEHLIMSRMQTLAEDLSDEIRKLRKEAVELAHSQMECRRLLVQDKESRPRRSLVPALDRRPKLAGATPAPAVPASVHSCSDESVATIGGDVLVKLVRELLEETQVLRKRPKAWEQSVGGTSWLCCRGRTAADPPAEPEAEDDTIATGVRSNTDESEDKKLRPCSLTKSADEAAGGRGL